MRKILMTLAAALALVLLFAFPPWGTALSQPPEEVLVLNLPDVVPIAGVVSVKGVVRQAEIFRQVDLIVPPADRERIDELVEAKDVEADGFTSVTLSLHGDVRGTIGRSGSVGVILLPDEVSVMEMFNEKGVYHFLLEAKVDLTKKEQTEFSVQRQFALGFPRYKVYLYNSTDRTMDVDLYVYLTQ